MTMTGFTRSGLRFRPYDLPSTIRTRGRGRIGRGVRQRSRFGRSFTRTQNRRQTRSGQGVTTQHDERRIYTKHTMPRRMKVRWKRFSNKVHAVAEKDYGSRTVVLNKSVTFSNTTNGNHGLAYMGLYTAQGTGDSFMADLDTISGLENPGNPTAAAGITVLDTTKFIFKSAVLDLTFRNTSTFNTLGVLGAASEAKLEVDVYEIISGREWTDTDSTQSDITSVFTRGAGLTPNLGGIGTGVTLSQRGVTPWDIPAALAYFRCKILRKTKYFLPNGDTFTYQVRDPKRRFLYQERMDKIGGGNMPRWSRHLLVLFKLVPGLTVGTGVATYQENLTAGITRKYLYKIEGANEDRDSYLANT